MKVYLKPGDEIEALSKLRLRHPDDLEFMGISEAAEGMNFAHWVQDESRPEGGCWFEVHEDLSGYYYDNTSPLE